jgi:hypothetical protein
MLPIESAFKVYADLNGNPLDDGYIYFGMPNQNPITAPVTVYWDPAGTQPAAQPLRTQNGYIIRSGTPANVFYSGTYSQIVNDKNGLQIYYARNSDDYSISNSLTSFITSLASSVGSSLVGFIQSGVGAVLRTVQAELRDRVTVKQFGAVGDGVTDDTASVPNASVVRGYAKEYLVTAYGDNYGRDLMPDGVAHDHVLGRVFNPRQQFGMAMFGQECLQHWYDKFVGASNKNSGDTTIRSIVISGDSTTYGIGATYGTPAALLEDLAEARGYTNVGVINRGQSGKATFDWVSTYLAGDLAANPDLLVLRWGANDPFFGRTVDQFIADLRSGLATCRASKTVAQMSILLMTPSSMNDVEKGRTELWSERIGPAIRQAARDYQCAFIDTYALFQNSHDAAGIWMDSDTSFHTPGRAIHPHDVLYEHIVGAMAEMVYPAYGTNWKANSVRNTSGGDTQAKKTGSEAPSTYFSGIGMHRMADGTGTVDGAPFDGAAFTFKQADGLTVQYSIPIADGVKGSGITARLGWNGSWSVWYGGTVTGATASALLVNGWANTGGAFQPFTYQMTLEGRVCLNGVINKGTVTDGTTLFTLSSGYRPRNTEILLIATELGTCRLTIDTSGVAKIFSFGAGGNYIALQGVSYRVGLT